MKTLLRLLVVAGLATLVGTASGEPAERRPSVGYLCCAGGQQGTTVRVIVGGQNLWKVRQVYVTGEGVTAKFVKRHGNSQRIRQEVLQAIRKQLQAVTRQKVNELRRAAGGKKPKKPTRKKPAKKKPAKKKATPKNADPKKADGKEAEPKKKDGKKAEPEVKIPDHPLLVDLPSMTLRELKKVSEFFFDRTRRLQESPQIAEVIELEVTIAADAPPGDREIRLGTGLGLTNPMLFEVGVLPEVQEVEPNDFRTVRQKVAEAPIVINGQVSVRDIDRFRFKATEGQKLVIETQARRLVPYMADAVPGWFQATVSILDASGTEIDFADDYRFRPDPVILFEAPATGEYELVIRDAIDRGREDFVYRISIAERPWVETIFPLGGQKDVAVTAEVTGWNLPFMQVGLDTRGGIAGNRKMSWRTDAGLTNVVPYAVDEFPECSETEPNDTFTAGQILRLPTIVNGRIGRVGEADIFRFGGKAGGSVAVEVNARRIGSPLDSRIELFDSAGKRIALNDDHPDRSAGLVTHQADSFVLASLPADGTYSVRITDAQGRGGPAFAYRLRVSPPRPDFTVVAVPSCINVNSGAAQIVTAHVVRRDGFDGPIDLALVDALPGFTLTGARIPAGRDRVRFTLTAPPKAPNLPISLEMEASGTVGGESIVRRVRPGEDQMQAFLNRHLVPTQEMLVFVRRSGRLPLRLATRGTIRLPAGGTAMARILAPGLPRLADVSFELDEGPKGIELVEVRSAPGGLEILLKADGEKVKAGYADNLIIAAYLMPKPKTDAKKGPRRPTRRTFIGVLPALSIEVVAE